MTLDDDVAAEIERLRRDEGIGPSEAVNRLIRAGLVVRSADTDFAGFPDVRWEDPLRS